jgi:PAS domain S-box-containing protein
MTQDPIPQPNFDLLDQLPEGIFVINQQGNVLSWNRCLENWSGIKSAEIIHKPITLYLPQLKEPQYRDRLLSIFQSGPPAIFSSQLHKHFVPCPLQDGSLRILHTIVTAYKAPHEETPYALFTIQDVTDSTARIKEYNLLHNQFKDEIRQRKEAESKMLKAKEEAEKANEAKSSFLSQMSHELRTPMNSILGFTQLMQMDPENPLSEQQSHNLERVTSAGNHLLALINEVLDLSKIEAGKIDLKMESVSMQKILQEVVSLSQPSALQNNVSLNITGLQQPDVFINGDYLRIKQILLNLVSNAIKFNKPEGSVNVYFFNKTEGTTTISVADTGSGLSPENVSKLFTPFERFEAGSTSIEGTGIGLTISQKLALAMQGGIEVVSALGKGSTFSLELPVFVKPPLENPAGVTPVSTAKATNTTGKKILYIEDIYENIELVRQILLSQPNYQFIYALDAMKGVEMALSESPDLILMDINMPGMSGLDAFAKLAEKIETKSIPVVALSADAMGADVKKAMDIGFYSYITKPIDVANFLQCMTRILE